jgi:hypothetical protein
MIELNTRIQFALLIAMNQSSNVTKTLFIQTVLKAQALASNATFLLNNASSLAQSAVKIHSQPNTKCNIVLSFSNIY